ncbi:hypothetical protein BCF11_2398 [Collimonas sp. PA-H2]|uniref:hypothetical protein n=1 Tax=Collimonas sp. PA-H2 TaxID=1881062 RepID=UPI000BF5FC85|nr:hypothetical protein [Collimonas sp. PA-H2]PFH09993.1 hypothetical protein BCF11_2398 [Collimonas sp. PA-H2]
MFGLTTLGLFHTVISLIAVAAALIAFFKYKEISWNNGLGKIYVIATVVTCLTGFGIFQHGGFGKPHALGIITLLALAIAALAEQTALLGRLARYVAVIGYSATVLFHMIPAITEASTRLPLGHPLLANAEDPALKTATAVLLALFLIGAALQVRRLRASR